MSSPETRAMANTFYEMRSEKLFIGEMTHFPFPLHVHDQAELMIVLSGEVTVGIGTEKYTLHAGDAAIAFPLVPHSYDELTGDSNGLVAIFPPETISQYEGTFHSLHPEMPVLRADQAGEGMRDATAQLSRLSMEKDLPLCIAYLHVLLASVLHRLTYRPVYDYNERGLGYRILQYVSSHACEEITLESAAHGIGISPSHLSHFFSERLNVHFRHFINAIRINRARMLMRNPNLTLLEICDACGFTNMRTFRRAFQQEMNCLPSEYMESLRKRIV